MTSLTVQWWYYSKVMMVIVLNGYHIHVLLLYFEEYTMVQWTHVQKCGSRILWYIFFLLLKSQLALFYGLL